MKTDYVIHKLISSLSRLSDRELHELADLFHRPDVGEVFGRIVEKTIYLRHVERNMRKRITHRETRSMVTNDQKQWIGAKKHTKDKFFAFLNDRSLFPSTRDVINVLNYAFQANFTYEEYRKRGRRDLIQKCWSKFENMSLIYRRRVLKLLSRRTVDHPHSSEGYHELFKILSQK